MEVIDLAGRVLLRLDGGAGTLPGGSIWDGRDSRGVEAPAGVYFLRVTGAEGGWATGAVRVLR